MSTCIVDGCERRVDSRGLCHRHYLRAWRRGDHNNVGLLHDPNAPLVCVCVSPSPDGIGECSACKRPVVTFLSIPDAERLWPDEYARALTLGLFPAARALTSPAASSASSPVGEVNGLAAVHASPRDAALFRPRPLSSAPGQPTFD